MKCRSHIILTGTLESQAACLFPVILLSDNMYLHFCYSTQGTSRLTSGSVALQDLNRILGFILQFLLSLQQAQLANKPFSATQRINVYMVCSFHKCNFSQLISMSHSCWKCLFSLLGTLLISFILWNILHSAPVIIQSNVL